MIILFMTRKHGENEGKWEIRRLLLVKLEDAHGVFVSDHTSKFQGQERQQAFSPLSGNSPWTVL